MTYSFADTVATTFSLTEEQRAKCSFCQLIAYPDANYNELRRIVDEQGAYWFMWTSAQLLRARKLRCNVVFARMANMANNPGLANAGVLVSIREYDGVAYAVIAPLYSARSSTIPTYAKLSADRLAVNNFFSTKELFGVERALQINENGGLTQNRVFGTL